MSSDYPGIFQVIGLGVDDGTHSFFTGLGLK
jgi:hypothetical protein